MKVTEKDWDKFWKFIENTNNFRIALYREGWMYVSYNPQVGKVKFINTVTGQKGELAKENFKRLFGSHVEYIASFLPSYDKMAGELPDNFYTANIIRHYFKWIA